MLSREPGAMRAAIWPRKPASHKDGSTPGEKGSRNTASKPEQGEGQAAGKAQFARVSRPSPATGQGHPPHLGGLEIREGLGQGLGHRALEGVGLWRAQGPLGAQFQAGLDHASVPFQGDDFQGAARSPQGLQGRRDVPTQPRAHVQQAQAGGAIGGQGAFPQTGGPGVTFAGFGPGPLARVTGLTQTGLHKSPTAVFSLQRLPGSVVHSERRIARGRSGTQAQLPYSPWTPLPSPAP